MKKFNLLFFLLLLYSLSQAQVGIGTISPRGALEISSGEAQNQGLVVPNVSKIEDVINTQTNNSDVPNGSIVYDISRKSFCFFINNKWSCITGEGGGIINPGTITPHTIVTASSLDLQDEFGTVIALSGDGNTLAVSAPRDDSNATGINGNQTNNSMSNAGAAYVFTRSDGDNWTQQAYIKPRRPKVSGGFCSSLALSEDGNTLAIGYSSEDYPGTGINSTPNETATPVISGAAYVYTRSGNNWTQQAYFKPSNPIIYSTNSSFGYTLALSGDGNTLAVGAWTEASNATGINGNQANNSMTNAGAAYVYTRSGGNWTQQAYIKASNTNAQDNFSRSIALSRDGNTLAVGATGEASNATGINGNQTNNSMDYAGAAYVFTRSGGNWTQQAYIKASNTNANDSFGSSLALSEDGNTLAINSASEDSNARGINGNQTDNSMVTAGAVFLFTRSGGNWTQQAYIKPSNTDAEDRFGWAIALSADGNILLTSSLGEDSNATSINGNQTDNSMASAGAVYRFTRSGNTWTQTHYIKSSKTPIAYNFYGTSVSVSKDGSKIAIGAPGVSTLSPTTTGFVDFYSIF